MDNKKLTRENINYQLTGLGMQLRCLRDALMCTFMDVPVNYFFELRGNLPVSMDDRMQFLERMVAAVDVESCKEAKSHIFNTNDKELAVKFCELNLVVWQLVMLCTRYEENHPTVERIAEMAGELLQLGHFMKTEMLHEEFFKFNTVESIQTRLLLEKVAKDRTGELSTDGMYVGWSQLEDAAKAYDGMAKAGVFSDFANHGKFEARSALEFGYVQKKV